ncbi:hsp70 family protein [Desulfuromonas thiophila]|uniref:Hsp70 protein n=1 Tax=Desulfuromonas thiophila TaxID=57664 RepID=A0A1G6ZY14_9BACT|nr:hsp70 family protein [Desulfuromonas thiophila]SDE07381.1 Hsp70 protein [Desulfuromonas thiophila]
MTSTARPRFCIGIDLGTTNTALAYVDRQQPRQGSQLLLLPQWDSAASIRQLNSLPSFAYLPEQPPRAGENQLPASDSPWLVGTLARQQMSLHPGRVIHSAKSWLCHSGVDRNRALLPWQSSDIGENQRLSPVQASALYLDWLRRCWNQQLTTATPEAAFEQQQIVLTVPASFDAAAQQLTLQAAALAGYPLERLSLLEEPQAAFYHWLGQETHLAQLRDLLLQRDGAALQVLVCDIGGGTTDLSLFRVASDPQQAGGLRFERLAVSEHLLLGGDNIDLTLAHLLEQRLTGGGQRLRLKQWHQLLSQARELKERLLDASGEEAQRSYPVTLSGSGANLFASTQSCRIAASELQQLILDGFFPLCDADARPQQQAALLQEWGLPYAQDSAVSRHLAGFIAGQRVDALLFNGGTLVPASIRQRLHQLLSRWQPETATVVLENRSLSLAVAQGAARYSWILGEQPTSGARIGGGYAHALYLEVLGGARKKDRSLVCILPKGLEAGRTLQLREPAFDLLVNQPVRFQCCYAPRRTSDRAGTLLPWNADEFRPLPPLQTLIQLPPGAAKPANNRLPVHLEVSLNELGLLQIACVANDGSGRWRLDFNLRQDASGSPAPTGRRIEADPAVSQALPLIRSLFAKKKDPALPEVAPKQLVKALERLLGPREDWNSATLRRLWPELAEGMSRKARSIDHEQAWLYLAGFVLRPGYGVELDSARIEQLWRLQQLGLAFGKEKRIENQAWLLWRRVAGGLNAGRQQQLYAALADSLANQAEPAAEMVYLAGALEQLPPGTKTELVRLFGRQLLRDRTRHHAPYFWALGRLLARLPLYAGPETVVHPQQVEQFFRRVASLDWRQPPWQGFPALFAQAARHTEQRDMDISAPLRAELLDKMRASGASRHQLTVVERLVPLDDNDRTLQFGEALPTGLILVRS